MKREFYGFKLSTGTLEKGNSIMALMEYMNKLFFAKLPNHSTELEKTAFDLLIDENQIVDGVGGRIRSFFQK